MNKGLFNINLGKNNGYTKNFNKAMRYMLEQMPECEIVDSKDDEILVKALSNNMANLIDLLNDADCLSMCEIRDV